MGNLLIFNESFSTLEESTINKQIANFIDSFNTAIHHKDKIFQDALLNEFEYQFGNFFADLVYGAYENIQTNEALKGLSQITHQELQNIFYKYPKGGSIVKDRDEFIARPNVGLIGVHKINHSCEDKFKVYDIPSWVEWNKYYYSEHFEEIRWGDSDFLPNLEVSNYLLSLDRNPKSGILKLEENLERAKGYCDDFNKRGISNGEKMALAENFGAKVAESNFYVYQHSLSVKESKRKKAKRKIYKGKKKGRDIYLSIDFHKCFCFEVCDHNGKHLCEIRFDGLPNGKNTQDTSGGHDIILV